MLTETVHAVLPTGRDRAFDFFADIRNLPRWATEFCLELQERDDGYVAITPRGEVKLRYQAFRDSGAIDVYSSHQDAPACLMPFRVVTTGTGQCVVLATLFQSPGMPEEGFRDMAAKIRRELEGAAELLKE